MAAPSIVPGETRIGWIGTGVMGASMLGHLIDAGFQASVYSRTKEKAQGVLDKGVHATYTDPMRAAGAGAGPSTALSRWRTSSRTASPRSAQTCTSST